LRLLRSVEKFHSFDLSAWTLREVLLSQTRLQLKYSAFILSEPIQSKSQTS